MSAEPNDPKVLAEVDAWFQYLKPARERNNLERQRSIILRIHRELKNNITAPTIIGWLLKQLRVKRKAANTVINAREAMQAYLNWRHEFRGAHRIALKLTIQRPTEPMPSITEEEYKRLLERMEHKFSPHWYGSYWPYALRMGWYTGQRISDIACCKWEYLSWADKCIRLTPVKTSRRNVKVEIPLPDEFLEWLKVYGDSEMRMGYAYMNVEMRRLYLHEPLPWGAKKNYWVRGKTIPNDWGNKRPPVANRKGVSPELQTAFRALAESAGIDKTFHAFRHSFVTRMLAAGVSPAIISMVTGQNIKMIMRYCSPTSAMLRSALGYDKPQIEVINEPYEREA